jgi:hypothetical protein
MAISLSHRKRIQRLRLLSRRLSIYADLLEKQPLAVTMTKGDANMFSCVAR